MIPIRNRKKTLEFTVDEMRNFALTYVEKYAPSKQQLKIYLLKKELEENLWVCPSCNKHHRINCKIVINFFDHYKIYYIKSYDDSYKK